MPSIDMSKVFRFIKFNVVVEILVSWGMFAAVMSLYKKCCIFQKQQQLDDILSEDLLRCDLSCVHALPPLYIVRFSGFRFGPIQCAPRVALEQIEPLWWHPLHYPEQTCGKYLGNSYKVIPIVKPDRRLSNETKVHNYLSTG